MSHLSCIRICREDASLNGNKWHSPPSVCDILFHSQQQLWKHVRSPDGFHGTGAYRHCSMILWLYDSFTLMQLLAHSSVSNECWKLEETNNLSCNLLDLHPAINKAKYIFRMNVRVVGEFKGNMEKYYYMFFVFI